MIKIVALIINPASGKDYPILSVVNRFFRKHKIEWNVLVTKKALDAEKFTRREVRKRVDAIVVFGGDGTVMEVAHGVSLSNTPLLILPGGTANVLAKELLIPQDPAAALSLLEEDYKVKTIDTFSVNGHPYFIRVNVGVFGDMVRKTKRASKNRFGSWAYAYTALTKMDYERNIYKLLIDGKKETVKGVGLLITNIGNVGLEGMSLLPDIKADDGKLDVIVIKKANLKNFLALVKGPVLSQESQNLIHFKGRNVELSLTKPQKVLLDDKSVKGDSFAVQIQPATLKFITPNIEEM